MHRFPLKRSGCIGLAGLIAATLACSLPAPSQELPRRAVAAPAINPGGPELLVSRVQAGAKLDRYLESLRQDFFQIDADADGKINQRDVDLHLLMEGIQLRTIAVSFVMRFDLDGDSFVTEDEIRRSMQYELRSQIGLAAFNSASKPQLPSAEGPARQIETTVRSIMAVDTDKDGKVNMTEAAKFGAPGGQRLPGQQSARARQALTLDISSRGEVSLAEYQAAGEALFRKVDADQDGKISQQEFDDNLQRLERAGCDMPAASEKAKVVVLSGYQTDALSSVTLGSQDSVIFAGRVVVEPGNDPLYVVISTYSPTIWQFSGAVERIERVVMSSSRSGPNSGDARLPSLVGATGIAPERAGFFSRSNCLGYFYETPSSTSLQTLANIRKATGKEPGVVAVKYSVSSYSIPSGQIETIRDQKPRALVIQKGQGTLNIIGDASNVIVQAGPSRAKDEMYRFFPGGVIEIDPKAVVSNVPAAPYEVLPSQAGLVQLLASGALTQNSQGEYIVRRKIRFPAGLAGAHSVTFLVMKGTPYPDGDPAHSCVIVEESGEKKGANCRQ